MFGNKGYKILAYFMSAFKSTLKFLDSRPCSLCPILERSSALKMTAKSQTRYQEYSTRNTVQQHCSSISHGAPGNNLLLGKSVNDMPVSSVRVAAVAGAGLNRRPPKLHGPVLKTPDSPNLDAIW